MASKPDIVRVELRISKTAKAVLEKYKLDHDFKTYNKAAEALLFDYVNIKEQSDNNFKLMWEEINKNEPLKNEIISLKAKIRAFVSTKNHADKLLGELLDDSKED